MSRPTLSEALGTNLIFTRIMSQHQVPWHEDTNITGALLDFEYNYNFSGDKLIAPAVNKNLGDDGKITTAAFNNLCDIVWMMYGQKWARLWEVQTAEFDPIENYSMTEKEETKYGKVDTNSGTDSTLRTGTDTHTESGTNTLLMTGTDTNAQSGTDQLQHGETHTLSGQDSLTHGEKHTLGGQDSLTYGEKHTLGGNDTLQHGETHTWTGGESTTDTRAMEHEVSAFNSSGYSDASKDTNSGGTSTTFNSKKDTASGTDTTGYGRTDTASGTDSTSYGRTDTASGTDTTGYGRTDTASGTDRTTYGKTDLETRNMTDATTFGHVDTENRNMTDALTHGHVVTASGKDERELTRTGNIGTTTSQQMLESSLELWKWNFFCDIFNDVDSIFTLSVY